jgi:hypothetical protein
MVVGKGLGVLRCAGMVLCAIAVVACIRIGGTQERRLVDLNDGSPEVCLRVAQEYATTAQLERLRASAKAQFPKLTDRDLATLGLRWQVMSLQDGRHTMIEVTIMPESQGADGKAVADFLAKQVLDDVRPKLTDAGATRG